MSADLFAAFGRDPKNNQGTSYEKGRPYSQAQQDIFSLSSSFAETQLDDSSVWIHSDEANLINAADKPVQGIGRPSEAAVAIADDEWGEFEEATTSKHQPTFAYVEQELNGSKFQSPWSRSLPSEMARETSTSGILVQNIEGEPTKSRATVKTVSKDHGQQETDTEVLFDADDEIDDFGDFESGPSNLAVQNPVHLQNEHEIKMRARTEVNSHGEDLISMVAEPPVVGQTGNSKHSGQKPLSSPTKPEQKPIPKSSNKATLLNGKSPRNRLQKKSAFQPLPNATNDDAWDNFEEIVAPETGPLWTTGGQNDDSHDLAWFSSLLPSFSRVSPVRPDDVPPTNIPPPTILMSLYPRIFRDMHTEFFQPLAGLHATLKTKLLGDAKTVEYLQGCLALVRTAAHIIAGRKYRWKRDTFLSQGMKIGPAGRSGGMKLTGIDKAENNKEEREVLDVVRAWSEQSGRLRSAVTGAQNASSTSSLGVIPDIQETMAVQTIKQIDGGVPAPHQCALCGLKRNERVVKIDSQVQDSFGEWWIEQVSMHKDCRNFWEEQKDSVRQR